MIKLYSQTILKSTKQVAASIWSRQTAYFTNPPKIIKDQLGDPKMGVCRPMYSDAGKISLLFVNYIDDVRLNIDVLRSKTLTLWIVSEEIYPF